MFYVIYDFWILTGEGGAHIIRINYISLNHEYYLKTFKNRGLPLPWGEGWGEGV